MHEVLESIKLINLSNLLVFFIENQEVFVLFCFAADIRKQIARGDLFCSIRIIIEVNRTKQSFHPSNRIVELKHCVLQDLLYSCDFR